jgi:hypothetical protein
MRCIYNIEPVLAVTSGLPDIIGAWYQNRKKCIKWTQNVPNEHKMYQTNTKCTKWTQNVPNEHKMYQMDIKIYPNCHFWFENKPSGSHGWADEWHGSNFSTVYFSASFSRSACFPSQNIFCHIVPLGWKCITYKAFINPGFPVLFRKISVLFDTLKWWLPNRQLSKCRLPNCRHHL